MFVCGLAGRWNGAGEVELHGIAGQSVPQGLKDAPQIRLQLHCAFERGGVAGDTAQDALIVLLGDRHRVAQLLGCQKRAGGAEDAGRIGALGRRCGRGGFW